MRIFAVAKIILIMTVIINAFNASGVPNQSEKPDLKLSISEDLELNAEMSFFLPNLGENQVSLFAVAIPFNVPIDTIIIPSNGVQIAEISSGEGYTIFAVMASSSRNPITILINKFSRLERTPDNRAGIQFDPTFKNVADEERSLLSLSTSIASWNISIILPKVYDLIQIGRSPELIQTDKTFYLSRELSMQNNKIYITFPASNNQIPWAEIFIAILSGVITLLLEGYSFHDRSLLWLVTAFVVAILVILTSGILLLSDKDPGTLIFIAAASSAAFVTFIMSGRTIVTRFFEVTYEGNVSVGQWPLEGAVVFDVDVTISNKTEHIKKEEYINGRYSFRKWIWAKEAKFRFSINVESTNGFHRSEETLKRGKHIRQNIYLIPLPNQPTPPIMS